MFYVLKELIYTEIKKKQNKADSSNFIVPRSQFIGSVFNLNLYHFSCNGILKENTSAKYIIDIMLQDLVAPDFPFYLSAITKAFIICFPMFRWTFSTNPFYFLRTIQKKSSGGKRFSVEIFPLTTICRLNHTSTLLF